MNLINERLDQDMRIRRQKTSNTIDRRSAIISGLSGFALIELYGS